MTSATAGVIKFLSGELDAARDEAQKARVVNEQCKPMIRNLAGQYDAEDEEALLDKKLKDYDAGFMAPLPRTVNGTGHTDPSEFCATSIAPRMP